MQIIHKNNLLHNYLSIFAPTCFGLSSLSSAGRSWSPPPPPPTWELIFTTFTHELHTSEKKQRTPWRWPRTKAETWRSNNKQITTLYRKLVLCTVHAVPLHVTCTIYRWDGGTIVGRNTAEIWILEANEYSSLFHNGHYQKGNAPVTWPAQQ